MDQITKNSQSKMRMNQFLLIMASTDVFEITLYNKVSVTLKIT